MLDRFLSRGVRVDLGSGPVRFRTPGELVLALSSRTALSSLRMAALGGLADEALQREADRFSGLEHQISRGLARSSGASGAGDLLAAIDFAEVTEDHEWRAILRSLRDLDGGTEAYKKAALLKFVEYLAAGQALVQTIRDNRRGAGAWSDEGGTTSTELSPRQALVFDPSSLAGEEPADGTERDEYNRMPKGESLEIELAAGQSLGLMLARYRFTLVGGRPYLLVDENGNDLRLHRGKNIVGRSAQCDVAVDPIFRSVSRRHVIIEAELPGPVRLTDISTLGTFVPRGYLDNRLH